MSSMMNSFAPLSSCATSFMSPSGGLLVGTSAGSSCDILLSWILKRNSTVVPSPSSENRHTDSESQSFMSPSSSYSTSSSSSSPRNDDGLLDTTSAQALLQGKYHFMLYPLLTTICQPEHEQVVSAKRTSFSSNPDPSSQDVKRIRSLTSLLPLSQGN